MSSGLFHWEWYTDPPWDRVALNWLINYIRSVQANPALAGTLAANREEFEMVPVPRKIVQSLAGAHVDEPSLFAPVLNPVYDRQAAVDYDTVSQVVRALARSLESGKAETVMQSISPNYFDAQRRDSRQLQEDLRRLASEFSGLRVVAMNPEQVWRIGDQIAARVHVAWDATLKKEGVAAEPKHGATNVEIILEKAGDKWSIVSLRTV